MISLRQHIDNFRASVPGDTTLAEFRLALVAIGESSQRAVPSLTTDLGAKLAEIAQSCATPANAKYARERAQTELFRWADSALQHHLENERKIIGVVAH